MTPEQAMFRKLDTAGIVRESIMRRAQQESAVLTAATNLRRIELNGAAIGSDEWLDAIGTLRDVADRLIEDVDGIAATVKTAQAIVLCDLAPQHPAAAMSAEEMCLAQTSMEHLEQTDDFPCSRCTRLAQGDLPCGHRIEDACEACVPWDAAVEAEADRFERGGA
jgi:hypothetical protein